MIYQKDRMYWLKRVLLLHAKSRQALYHFTALEGAYRVLKTNKLKKSEKHGNLSFTRDKNLTWYKGNTNLLVRFKVDSEKLRHNFKIEPFVWPKYAKDSTRGQGWTESEEIINNDIRNFDKYLEEICFVNIRYWSTIRNLMVNVDILADEASKNRHLYQNLDKFGKIYFTGSGDSIKGFKMEDLKIKDLNRFHEVNRLIKWSNEVVMIDDILRNPKVDKTLTKAKGLANKMRDELNKVVADIKLLADSPLELP